MSYISNKYETVCLEMATKFVNGYYKHYNKENATVFSKEKIQEMFIQNDPTSIFEIGDMWLHINDVYLFYKLKCNYDTFIDWYWCNLEEEKISLENYIKNNKV